jgi:hypothetical protein
MAGLPASNFRHYVLILSSKDAQHPTSTLTSPQEAENYP